MSVLCCMTRRINIVLHMPREEIERLYKKEKDPRVKERLQATILLPDKKTAIEIAGIPRFSDATKEQ